MKLRDGARVYIAGKMTGMPEFNYPLFNSTAKFLRDLGFVVENPAENQTPPCGSWGGWLKQALRQMLLCDAVLLLDDWEDSRGARLERFVATEVGIPCIQLRNLFGDY